MNVHPYLNFAGNCREAFDFYARLFGTEIDQLMTHGELPADMQVHENWTDKIMHEQMKVGDTLLMGSDAPPPYYNKPQGFSVALQLSDAGEAERIFAALAEGGTVRMAITKTFWAERFGMVTDRFDVPWIINCAPGA